MSSFCPVSSRAPAERVLNLRYSSTQHLAHYRALSASGNSSDFPIWPPWQNRPLFNWAKGHVAPSASTSTSTCRRRNCPVLKYALMKLSCPTTASRICELTVSLTDPVSAPFRFPLLLLFLLLLVPAATLNKSISGALWLRRGVSQLDYGLSEVAKVSGISI